MSVNRPETDHAYYLAHKARKAETGRAWALSNPERRAFINQRKRASQRGVGFIFTFEAWVAWWGDDFVLRGRQCDSLQMGRYGDTGPYEIGNVYKVTKAENEAGPRPFPEPGF